MSNVLFVTTPDKAKVLREDADGPTAPSPINPIFNGGLFPPGIGGFGVQGGIVFPAVPAVDPAPPAVDPAPPPGEKPVEKAPDKPAEKPPEKPGEKPPEKPVQSPPPAGGTTTPPAAPGNAPPPPAEKKP
jgi:hypothetical protein